MIARSSGGLKIISTAKQLLTRNSGLVTVLFFFCSLIVVIKNRMKLCNVLENVDKVTRIVVFYIAIVSIFASPVWSQDNGTTKPASPKKQLLQGSVRHTDTSLNDSVTQLKGMSAVQDAEPSNGQGVGMLGTYALCASDPASPAYITNVFPTSQLVQFGVQSGDLLLQINGKSPFDYLHTAHTTVPGATISITFQHDDTTKKVSVKLSDMRTFIPFLQSYSQWLRSHIQFMKEQRDKYRECALL